MKIKPANDSNHLSSEMNKMKASENLKWKAALWAGYTKCRLGLAQ